MIFRVYLRDAQQRVTEKTTTGSPEAALAAFKALVERTDLDGQRLLAVLSRDGAPVAHHDFSKPAPPAPGSVPARWWRDRTPDLTGSAL
ncbi:MAG TPA: hypothetical protein PKK15_19860 [Kouleothrix sp.]|nr:hypothetical protein [Kouleothrix sp.]